MGPPNGFRRKSASSAMDVPISHKPTYGPHNSRSARHPFLNECNRLFTSRIPIYRSTIADSSTPESEDSRTKTSCLVSQPCCVSSKLSPLLERVTQDQRCRLSWESCWFAEQSSLRRSPRRLFARVTATTGFVWLSYQIGIHRLPEFNPMIPK